MSKKKRTTPQPTFSSKKKSTFKEVWFIVVIVLIALVLLLYPAVSTQWNNYRQHQVADAYSHDVGKLGNEKSQEIVKKAQQYNKRNAAGPIIDPWNSRVSKDNKIYQEYLQELNTLDAMTEVTIPSINVDLPVYHGTEDSTLSKGLGHLFGTALPVGGKNTHAVITGHTGMPNATMFDNLTKVKEGDSIYLNTYGKKMKYEVYSTEVVLPEETDSLWPKKDEDLITLITCTPYGVNSHRLLVHAHRVPMDNEDENNMSIHPFFMQWWMFAFALLAFLSLEFLIIYIFKTHKRVSVWNKKIDKINQ